MKIAFVWVTGKEVVIELQDERWSCVWIDKYHCMLKILRWKTAASDSLDVETLEVRVKGDAQLMVVSGREVSVWGGWQIKCLVTAVFCWRWRVDIYEKSERDGLRFYFKQEEVELWFVSIEIIIEHVFAD